MRRTRILLWAALFVLTVFAAQLVKVQGLDAASTQALATDKRQVVKPLPALRGTITDANGTVLASSVEQYTVSVNQTAVVEYKKRVDGSLTTVGAVGAATDLAPLLGTTPAALVPQLMGTSAYRIIAKDITPLRWQEIRALGIPGIYAEQTTRRVYPSGQAAASLVGFMQANGSPGGGLEVMANKALTGTPGNEVYQQASDGTMIPWAQSEDQPAVNGLTVRTTLDADLQWYSENQIAAMVQKSGAQSGYVVVEDVTTGELKAVASYPTFDPTNLKGATSNQLMNHAFEDVYEPGSTGKVMSIAAAVDQGLVDPTSKVIVPNRLPRSDTTFKDDIDHPTWYLTLTGVMAKSSNIGTMLATEAVAPTTMEQYYRKFGIGTVSGAGFPGESPGLLAKAGDWSGSQRFTVLFGQGYSVNAIQSASVYQTIANGGVRIPPSIVAGTTDASGTYTPATPPASSQVVSPATADKVASMLEAVVGKGGTAPAAEIPGYRVAGKTGTADRYDAKVGGYNGFTASFIGFAPADKPRFVVAVILQAPVNGHFGGQLGAPVFKDVMTYALQRYQVPPTGAAGSDLPLDSGGAAWDVNDPSVISNKKTR